MKCTKRSSLCWGGERGISRHFSQSKLLEQTFSGIIGCTKYASAGENRRETQESQERETLVGETEEEEKMKVFYYSFKMFTRF